MRPGATAPGEIYENPVTGERALMIEGDRTGEEERILAELTVRPGGAVAGEHVHPATRERFFVLAGRLGVRIDGAESVGEVGDSFTVEPGTPHDWWNAGTTDARVLVEVSPPGRFTAAILTMFGLARAGVTNPKGMPGPLQLALVAREFDDVIRFTSPPPAVQQVAFGVLAPIARARGLKPTSPYGEVETLDTASAEFRRARRQALEIWPSTG